MRYKELLFDAAQRTGKLNFENKLPPLSDNIFLDEKNDALLFNIIVDLFRDKNSEYIFAQCFYMNIMLYEKVKAALSCYVIFTIGWIDDGTNDGMFKFTENDLLKNIENNFQNNKAVMHAWLTLPSLEIIDITISTTQGVLSKKPDMIGRYIAKRADEIINMKYIPMIIGTDFVFKSGMVKYVFI